MQVRTENTKQKSIPKSQSERVNYAVSNKREERINKEMQQDDESDTEQDFTDRRYTWLDKNGQIASRKLTSYECRLEDDVQRLQDALFSISSHYAKIQFRLRQIASSTGSERLCLLRDLEKITCEGIDASKDNDELPSLLEDSQSFGDVRLRQEKIISQLRGSLSNLMSLTDVFFPPETECSYKTRKYLPRNGKSNDQSTLEKGYLCEVWPDKQNKPRMVKNNDDDDDNDEEEPSRPPEKRKSKSKKKRHRKSSKKNKKSQSKNLNVLPPYVLRKHMPDPLLLPSNSTLSPRKKKSSKKRRQKDQEVPSSNLLSEGSNDQQKSDEDPQYNRKYNKRTEGSDRYTENSSEPFTDWTCGEPKCKDDCKCSITSKCIEINSNENNSKKKSSTFMKSPPKPQKNKKIVNFLIPEKDSTQLRPKGGLSSFKSVKKALSSYFQGSRSSFRRKSASSTLVYPHAIGKPSNLCKTQSRVSFRQGSSIKLTRCGSSDLSDLNLDDSQHIEESQF